MLISEQGMNNPTLQIEESESGVNGEVISIGTWVFPSARLVSARLRKALSERVINCPLGLLRLERITDSDHASY